MIIEVVSDDDLHGDYRFPANIASGVVDIEPAWQPEDPPTDASTASLTVASANFCERCNTAASYLHARAIDRYNICRPSLTTRMPWFAPVADYLFGHHADDCTAPERAGLVVPGLPVSPRPVRARVVKLLTLLRAILQHWRRQQLAPNLRKRQQVARLSTETRNCIEHS